MDNPGNTGDLDPHAAAHVGAFERLMDRLGSFFKRDEKIEPERQPFGSRVHKNYPRMDWFDKGGRDGR